jgi:serine/threonine-protein kinase ATR
MVSDQELNLVLLKLVEYLGHENDVITALAFQELSNIAAARGSSTAELFKPFWRGLAHLAVKDVIVNPRITTLVADLLGISVNEFLVDVQSYALPWLVLQGKKDVVERISAARKHGNVHSTIVDTTNCGPILALLLIQPVEDVAAFAMAKLSEISSHFSSMEFPQLARSELTQIVLEVFKLAAEGGGARKLAVGSRNNEITPKAKPNITQAKNALTQLSLLLGIPGETRSRKGNLIGRFLAPHVLGLMARITEVINNVGASGSSLLDQRLCLQAMEEMIRVCKAHVRVARPQVSTSLASLLCIQVD